MGFHYDIFYKPGVTNRVVDALSRCPEEEPHVLNSLSSAVPTILSQLRAFYDTTEGKEEIKSNETKEEFTNQQGMLWYKGGIYIPETTGLRSTLLAHPARDILGSKQHYPD